MISIKDKLPDSHGFLWVWRESKAEPELAFYSARLCMWQTPYTVGDNIGLPTEYFYDVTHWQNLQPPDMGKKKDELIKGYDFHVRYLSAYIAAFVNSHKNPEFFDVPNLTEATRVQKRANDFNVQVLSIQQPSQSILLDSDSEGRDQENDSKE